MPQKSTARTATSPPDRAAFRAERRKLREAIRAKRTLLKGRAAFEKAEEKRKFKAAVARDKAKREHDAALSRADLDMQRKLQSVAAQLRALESEQQQSEERQLQLLRSEYIGSALRRAHISVKELNGFGTGLVNDLATRGIRTASDFTGVSRGPAPSGKGGDVMWIHVTNGRRIHINGIGEHRAKVLIEWRRSYLDRAKERAPKRITLADRRRIEEATERRRVELEEQKAAAQATADEVRTEAKNTLTAALTRLDAEDRTAAREAAAQRAQYDTLAQELARLEAELEALNATRRGSRSGRPSHASPARTYPPTSAPNSFPQQRSNSTPADSASPEKTKSKAPQAVAKRPSLAWLIPIAFYLGCALTGTPNLAGAPSSGALLLFLGHTTVVGYLFKQWLQRRREWKYLGATSRMPALGLNLIWVWLVALVVLNAQYG